MEDIMLDTKAIAKLACCMALALFTAPLAAQQTSTPTQRKPGDLDAIRKVTKLIGTDVMNHTNVKIANIRDLVLSPDGAVTYAILGFGGVAGVGETYTAVPYDLLGVRHDDGKWAINLDMTADNLKTAPAIKSENYRELLDPQWIARVDQFVRGRGESQHHPDRTSEATQREHRVVERVLLVTKIRGASLKNGENQDLGKVVDLLLDRTDRMAFVIIGRGGVLGIGENYIPVPWSQLRLGENRENAAVTVMIDATKAQLERAPLVKGDSYATLLAPGFADQVREYFRMAGRQATNGSGQKN
jgi:PRC-barrel domain